MKGGVGEGPGRMGDIAEGDRDHLGHQREGVWEIYGEILSEGSSLYFSEALASCF